MENITITDNHIHVDPINGEGPLEVAKKFGRAGGNVMIIPNKPTWTVGKSCNFDEAMELVIKYVSMINENTNVRAFAVVGAHPAELSRRVKNGMELDLAEKMMKATFEAAQKLVIEDKAIGIGEIGRPHYEVSPEEMEVHNRLILYAMELAADADCAVQLHTESAEEKQFLEFAEMADKAGLERHKVIKHFSGPLVSKDENHGLTPSLIATKSVIVEGIKKGNNFLMETDYLDMLSRPGAVLGPKTVPRRTKDLLQKGILTEEDVYKIHVENVEKVYGIDLE
ncbi:TatD family hydrolase [Methanobacterium oryzae]|uniref:TatD family hydrolase n=1 Tax=Methanobacterium oryzae TaxID=69540 RepID=UPI003D1BE40D